MSISQPSLRSSLQSAKPLLQRQLPPSHSPCAPQLRSQRPQWTTLVAKSTQALPQSSKPPGQPVSDAVRRFALAVASSCAVPFGTFPFGSTEYSEPSEADGSEVSPRAQAAGRHASNASLVQHLPCLSTDTPECWHVGKQGPTPFLQAASLLDRRPPFIGYALPSRDCPRHRIPRTAPVALFGFVVFLIGRFRS